MRTGILRDILRNRIILILFILDILLISAMVVFFIIEWTILASSISSSATLFSSLIALLLPFTIVSVQKREKREEFINKRRQGFKAFQKLCDFYFEHLDPDTGNPEDNIEVLERTKMIPEVQTMYNYREHLISIGIIISSGWKDIEGTHHIYIHSDEEIYIDISAHDFGKIKKISLKYKGVIINDKNILKEPFERIEKRMENNLE